MPFKYPIKLVYNAVKTLIDIRKPINVDEARDDCLMDVHLSYTGDELPSLTPTPQDTAEAIEEWNNVRISNEDYNNQEKTNRLFSQAITLMCSNQEEVYNACKGDWREEGGSKATSHHRDSTQLDRTLLSISSAAKDVSKYSSDSTNVMLDEAGEKIFAASKWDAFIAFIAIRLSMEFLITCCIESGMVPSLEELQDFVEQTITTFTSTFFAKSGKTKKSKLNRMKDNNTYAQFCPVTGKKLFNNDCFEAMPILSMSNAVTSLMEWLPLFIFSCFGLCFNQKLESITTTRSEEASFSETIKFYLSATVAGRRSKLYERHQTAILYHGQKIDINIRSAFKTLIDFLKDKRDDELESIRSNHSITVMQSLRGVSGPNAKKPIHKVICPSGKENRAATIIAIAHVIALKGFGIVDATLDDKHRQIRQDRERASMIRRGNRSGSASASGNDSSTSSSRRHSSNTSSSSSGRSRSSSISDSSTSSTSSDNSTPNNHDGGSRSTTRNTTSSRAMVEYDPIKCLLDKLKHILTPDSGLSPSEVNKRMKEALVILATMDINEVTVKIQCSFDIDTFVNMLNDGRDSAFDDDSLHVGVLDVLLQIKPFKPEEFANGSDLFWLQRLFIFALNRIYSDESCTHWTNMLLFANIQRKHRRTTSDADSIKIITNQADGGRMYMFTAINLLRQSNKNSQYNSGQHTYHTIAEAESFEWEAFESIGCSPDQYQAANAANNENTKKRQLAKLKEKSNNKKSRKPPSR